MTEETDVEKLDFSKPPPGYEVAVDGEFSEFAGGGETWGWTSEDGKCHGSICESEEEAIDEGWEDFKAHSDPPGLEVYHEPEGQLGVWMVRALDEAGHFADFRSETEARAAAWAWYERRLALVERLEGEGVQLDMWPAALVWTDEECGECEAWPGMRALPDDFPAVLRRLADGGELPEVLR